MAAEFRPVGEPLEIRVALEGDVAVVTARGEIDLATSPRLDAALGEAVASSEAPVVVDLSGVSFMDSTGLHVLLAALRRLEGGSRRMALVCPSQRIRQVFALTRMDDLFALHDSLEDARTALRRRRDVHLAGEPGDEPA